MPTARTVLCPKYVITQARETVSSKAQTSLPARGKTRKVMVGDVAVGGGEPVVVQSMLKSPPSDVKQALVQTERLAEAGCRLIRVAVPDKHALEPLKRFCAESPLPVIADIHFNYKLALGAIESGVSKVRLNPGNLKDREQIRQVVERCKDKGLPIRVGANSGSIKERSRRDERLMVDALLDGVVEYCQYIESLGFRDIIVSLKASDVQTNTAVYRAMAGRSDYPLHVGLTATGPMAQGVVRSSIALGSLLVDGIGDTVRVSLTGDPLREVELAYEILRASGRLFDRPVIVSCPTCGRCEGDVIGAVEEVAEALKDSRERIKVAVMGCVVNGPGEAKECDYGVACGVNNAVLFRKGEIVKHIRMTDMVSELLNLLEKEQN
ncbi:MAG: flavodoxin-dependent (E)-4-hydroxy-3-methylbut-2-enyl-diphosphate synthase [Planctomycetota bacterium]|nr:flavodoxin-dependent (E)-4-hydroxy-3-methylbut-2-enyl-diphosphate synthase [Planctomycetota bacterium]